MSSGNPYTLVKNDNLGRFIVEHDSGLVHELSTSQTNGNGAASLTGYRLVNTHDGHHLQNALTYTYDADGYITAISDSSGRSVGLAWSTLSQWCSNSRVLTSITDPALISTNLTYQVNGAEAYLSSIVEAAGTADQRTTSFAYEPYSPSDPYARLTSITDPMLSTTSIEYQCDATYCDKRVKSITDAYGKATTFSYHDNFSGTEDRMYVEDANGAISVWSKGVVGNHPNSVKAANLYNGSFERTAGSNPDGWTFDATGGSGSRDTVERYAGVASVKLVQTNPAAYARWYQCLYCGAQRFYGLPGNTYTGRAWVKLDNVQGTGAWVTLHYFNETTGSGNMSPAMATAARAGGSRSVRHL